MIYPGLLCRPLVQWQMLLLFSVVLWWQAIEFQIFVVVSEMPSFHLSWECVRFDIANCKSELREEDGWRGPMNVTGNFQQSNQHPCKYLIFYRLFFCRVFLKLSRNLKGGKFIHKWDQGVSEMYLPWQCSWLTSEGESARWFRTKRKLPSVCFIICLSTSSHASFDCNHFVKGKDNKRLCPS